MLDSLILTALLASCSGAPPAPAKTAESEERRFSAEDRRVARKLSLGNKSMLSQTSDPKKQALLCRDAIGAIERVLANSGALNGEQLKALQSAKLFYQNQFGAASLTAANEGASGTQGSAIVTPDEADNGRMAIACLQRLQDLGAKS